MSALKTMNVRTVALTLSALAVAVYLGACQGQPLPPCPVAAGSPLGAPSGGSPLTTLPDFWAKYTLKSANATDACAKLIGEEVAFQKYSTPGDLTNFTVALRTYRMGYQQGSALDYGSADSAQDYIDDSDPMNPVPASDPVLRQDPADPDNKKMSAIGKLTPFPDANNICKATDFSAADENFAEVDVDLADGGTASTPLDPNEPLSGTAIIMDDGGVATAVFPALHEKYEWSNIEFVSTTALPGTVFKGSLVYTQDTCSATYDVFGVWPLTPCHTDTDCAPAPVPDAVVCHNSCMADSDCDSAHPKCNMDGLCANAAGNVCEKAEVSIPTRKFQGSGMNPSFATTDNPLKCDNDPRIAFILSTYGIGGDWGACEVTQSFDNLQKITQ
jgi:hypothetical protein